jgi:hypothetical protein
MVPKNTQQEKDEPRKARRYRIEIVRDNGVIEFMKIGFAEIRELYNRNKEKGNNITIKEGLVNLILDKAFELAALGLSDSSVKKITLTPEQ